MPKKTTPTKVQTVPHQFEFFGEFCLFLAALPEIVGPPHIEFWKVVLPKSKEVVIYISACSYGENMGDEDVICCRVLKFTPSDIKKRLNPLIWILELARPIGGRDLKRDPLAHGIWYRITKEGYDPISKKVEA